MAVFSLAGVSLPVSKVTRVTPYSVGDMTRAFAGNLRNSVRLQKRIWNITLAKLDAVTEASVQSTIANGGFVTCSGDIFNNGGANVTCSVQLTSSEPTVGVTFYDVSLLVTEV